MKHLRLRIMADIPLSDDAFAMAATVLAAGDAVAVLNASLSKLAPGAWFEVDNQIVTPRKTAPVTVDMTAPVPLPFGAEGVSSGEPVGPIDLLGIPSELDRRTKKGET